MDRWTWRVGGCGGCESAVSGRVAADGGRFVNRAAVPLAGLTIIALMLAGAYALGAYVPTGVARIVAVWGAAREGRAADAVEVVGVRRSLLRGVRSRGANDTAWAKVLRVVVEPASASAPAVIGRYSVQRDRIRFEPRFPFAPGVGYRVDFDADELGRLAGVDAGGNATRLTHRFMMPAATPARTTRVVAVHPAVERVPSNMLRWYVEFSAPMEPGTAHEHVRLLDETGRSVEGAFLGVGEELWDPARRRLTLLFDPGRVKRGVRANIEMGPPLVAGHRYRLVIDAAWRDAAGAALASGFDKQFDVGSPDRTSPDPARWRLTVPRAGTLEPVRVTFGESLDHALAQRMLAVEGPGLRVEGRVVLADGDSVWNFTPLARWRPGGYTLRVDAALEDLAGNSVARLFDADRQRGAPGAEGSPQAGAARTIAFRVSP